MSEHSKTPWDWQPRLPYDCDKLKIGDLVDADGEWVASIDEGDYDGYGVAPSFVFEKESDLQFAKRAIDSHDQLVEALREGVDDGMDGDLLSIVAETLRSRADYAGGEGFGPTHMRALADRLSRKQTLQAAALAQLQPPTEGEKT